MSEPTLEDEVEFTELFDANIPRVDLVGKGANGMPFLIAKADGNAGVLGADMVRDLVAKATPEPPAEAVETVTLTGSPGAIARMIHTAPVRKTQPIKEQTVSDTAVVKDDAAPVDVADIIPEAPGGTTAQSVPGSPDWEQLDADTAETAISVLGRARAAVEWLATREATEGVATGDGDDYVNVWDLEDACCAIDCAIRTLGAFAAGEKLEANLADELEAVGKAAHAVAHPLAQLEPLVSVAKAGRVLSAANEQRIQSASDALAEVLATLPAPVEDGDVVKSKKEAVVAGTQDEPVAAVESDVTKAETTETTAPAVVKAKGDPQVAVYTADGKLVGVVDQADISPIAAPAAPEGGDEQSTDTADEVPADDTAATDTSADDADAGATVPGTDTVAAPAPTEDDTVAKSEPLTKAHLEEVLNSIIAKVGEKADAAVVKALEEELAEVKKMPDDRKSPLVGGGTGTAGIADRDGTTTDPNAELRKAVDEAADPVAKAYAEKALFFAQVKNRFTN